MQWYWLNKQVQPHLTERDMFSVKDLGGKMLHAIRKTLQLKKKITSDAPGRHCPPCFCYGIAIMGKCHRPWQP